MNHTANSLHLWVISLGFVASCTAPPADPTDLDRPLFGGEETQFVMQPGGGELKLRDAAAVAKVLRKYRDTTAAEQALVKLAVRRHIDGLLALELRKLEQAAAPERARIKAMPDAVARKRADDALSAKLLAEASRRVAAQMGGLLAVPLQTASSQSVVSFARLVSGDIRVADAAYELDVPKARLSAGDKVMAAMPGLKDLGRVSGPAQVLLAEQPIAIK
jgi:hypothetical protein